MTAIFFQEADANLFFLTGIAIQLVERSGSTMVRSPFPCHHLPVVGSPLYIDLRQPSEYALERIRVFRRRLHYPYYR
jgi:hypothetical protein